MTNKPTREELANCFRTAIRGAIGLPAEDVSNVWSLIDVGEWLVAFETLCIQIYEWEISLDPELIRGLEGLGGALGASRTLTDHLWEDAGRDGTVS